MKISTRGRYAIRVLLDLAEHNTGEYIPLMDIAKRQEISEKYLESIVSVLSKQKFVKALRGKGGGYFENIPGADYAIVRPEFVKVTRKNEVQKYKSSASEAEVERVAFRGSYFELGLKVGDITLSAKRGLDEPLVHQGEKVDVFVQRLFAIKENKVYALENSSIREDYLVI